MRESFWFCIDWIPLLKTLSTEDFWQAFQSIMDYAFHDKPFDYTTYSNAVGKVLRQIEPELIESLKEDI